MIPGELSNDLMLQLFEVVLLYNSLTKGIWFHIAYMSRVVCSIEILN